MEQLESRLFEQDEKGLAEMIELLGIDDDLAGKSKMQKIKIITKTIDSKMAGDEKEARACLEQLTTCFCDRQCTAPRRGGAKTSSFRSKNGEIIF